MKKILINLIIVFILIATIINIPQVKASEEYETLDLTIEDINKGYKLYVLLPREYIEYAIAKSGLDIEYIGAETLTKEDIPGIEIDKTQVQPNVYTEQGVEYIQVLLQATEQNHYQFKVLKSYGQLDVKFKFQINGENESVIMHLENFSANKNDTYNIKYNYEKETLKNVAIRKGYVKWWPIVIIILIILFIIFITKRKK